MTKKQTIRTVVVVTLIFLALALLAYIVDAAVRYDDQPSDPQPASVSQLAECKEAMRRQFREAVATNETGTQPPECDGVSDEDLRRLAYEVLDEEMAR